MGLINGIITWLIYISARRSCSLILVLTFGLSYISKLTPTAAVYGPLLLHISAITRHLLSILDIPRCIPRNMATSQGQKLYSITIFGYKKAGMNEKDYHDHMSKTHAGHLKALLAQNDIVSYTMVSRKPRCSAVDSTSIPAFPPTRFSIMSARASPG